MSEANCSEPDLNALLCCDACVDARVNKAIKSLPEVMASLAT